MKKAIFTLSIFMMAFGNAGFAQRGYSATEIMLKHYGVRDDASIVPQVATWQKVNGEQHRITYTYDEYDYYLIEELTETNLGTGWMPDEMLTYEYDFAGNVLEITDWDYENGDWELETLASYTYDGDVLSEIIFQYWDGNDWVNKKKEVYNFNGDVSTVLTWDWNGTNWTSHELYTYTHGNGYIELVLQYMQGGAWQNDERKMFTLDFNENVTEILVEDWQANQWVNDNKVTYDFNLATNVFDVRTEYDWENGAWMLTERSNYTYQDGNATHATCETLVGGQYVPYDGDMEVTYNYNAKSLSFDGCSIDVVYFDVTGLQEAAQAVSFKVYPMPVENEISVQTVGFMKAELFSVTGQKVMESRSSTLNVSDLQSGVYLLKVYDLEGRSATQRIVVK